MSLRWHGSALLTRHEARRDKRCVGGGRQRGWSWQSRQRSARATLATSDASRRRSRRRSGHHCWPSPSFMARSCMLPKECWLREREWCYGCLCLERSRIAAAKRSYAASMRSASSWQQTEWRRWWRLLQPTRCPLSPVYTLPAQIGRAVIRRRSISWHQRCLHPGSWS